MTGGRYKAAAGQQVCSWRTGCCAGVMKAKQKNRINGAITTWTEAKRSPAFYCILQAPPGREAPPQTECLICVLRSEWNDIMFRSEELFSASATDATRGALWMRLSCDQTPLKQTCSTWFDELPSLNTQRGQHRAASGGSWKPGKANSREVMNLLATALSHPTPICHFFFFPSLRHQTPSGKYLETRARPSLKPKSMLPTQVNSLGGQLPSTCAGWSYFLAKAEGNFVRWNYVRQTTLQMS